MMRSTLALIGFIIWFPPALSTAQQQPAPRIFSVGAALAVGGMRDSWEDGFFLSAGKDLRPSLAEPMAVRLEANYAQFGFRHHAASKSRVISLATNLVYAFTQSTLHPHAIGGVSLSHVYRPPGPSNGLPAASSTAIGYDLGAGVSFARRSLAILLESRYHYVFTEDETPTFLPITVGIRF